MSVGFVVKKRMPCASASLNFASSANSTEASGAVPYVVINDSWFAASSRRRGTRLGTEASFAGIQNRLTDSIRNDAANSHGHEWKTATVMSSEHRNRSQVTIVLRRSKRSANAPANGPKTTAGSNRKKKTPPIA